MQNKNKNLTSDFHEYASELRTRTLASVMDPNLIDGSHDLGTNHKILYHYCTLNSFSALLNLIVFGYHTLNL